MAIKISEIAKTVGITPKAARTKLRRRAGVPSGTFTSKRKWTFTQKGAGWAKKALKD